MRGKGHEVRIGREHWNPPWPLTWQRAFHAARRHQEAGHSLTDVPRDCTTDDGHRLGEWLRTQRLCPERLAPCNGACSTVSA